jgi:hypothetical protein
VFSLAAASRTGGFSPARTFGPVVATDGLGVGALIGEVTAVDTLVGALVLSVPDGPFEPLLVQPTTPVSIRAISATSRNRTPRLWHAARPPAPGCPQAPGQAS